MFSNNFSYKYDFTFNDWENYRHNKKDDDDDKDNDNDDKDDTQPSDKLIFGLPQPQFYSALGMLFIVSASTNFGRIYLLRSVGERLVARLRSRLFLKILAQDAYF